MNISCLFDMHDYAFMENDPHRKKCRNCERREIFYHHEWRVVIKPKSHEQLPKYLDF